MFRDAGAIFSPDRVHRYTLWREWADGGTLNMICLNPSKADEQISDPTVTRQVKRAIQLGFGRFVMTNLFAFRSTYPEAMMQSPLAVGVLNDHYLLEVASRAEMVICAWGKDGGHMGRGREVSKMLLKAGLKLHALRISEKTGQPVHPLYLSYGLTPFVWGGLP